MENYYIKEISIDYKTDIIALVSILNTNINTSLLEQRLINMFQYPTYKCFGLFNDNILIGLTSCWASERYYCGLQLEIDNLIVDTERRGLGLGEFFIKSIIEWAKSNGYESIELNTYISNSRSHKFYFNQGFDILGFHFQKLLK